MLDGRVLEASQVEYKPFGKPPLKREPGAGLARAWWGLVWALVRAWCGPWCGPGAGHVWAWRGPGAGLVRAWCGPGAGLAILRWTQECSFNPAVGTELLRSILSPQQDCPDAAPASVLARAQPCDGAGPAVELPGFRHVVYAQEEGQAACEERVSEL